MNVKKCTKCNKNLNVDAKFCPFCGTQLPAIKQVKPKTSKSSRSIKQISFAIIIFLNNKIRKKSKIENVTKLSAANHQKNKRKLSVGVYILSILLIIIGGIWILHSLIACDARVNYFIWGAVHLVGGIGLLRRKYWALRLNQVAFVLSALGCLLLIPIAMSAEEIDPFIILIISFGFIIYIVAPLWFLFKKSTVDQFKKAG